MPVASVRETQIYSCQQSCGKMCADVEMLALLGAPHLLAANQPAYFSVTVLSDVAPTGVSVGTLLRGEYKTWTKHGRNMDDPWTTGF